jgi:hypothetical protein
VCLSMACRPAGEADLALSCGLAGGGTNRLGARCRLTLGDPSGVLKPFTSRDPFGRDVCLAGGCCLSSLQANTSLGHPPPPRTSPQMPCRLDAGHSHSYRQGPCLLGLSLLEGSIQSEGDKQAMISQAGQRCHLLAWDARSFDGGVTAVGRPRSGVYCPSCPCGSGPCMLPAGLLPGPAAAVCCCDSACAERADITCSRDMAV